MWKITVAAFLLFVVHNLYCSQGALVTATTPLVLNGTNCTHPGVICSNDCKNVVLCLDVGGTLEPIVVQDCDADTFCNADTHTCEPLENSTCPVTDYVFKCTSRGFYPDPYDCHKYYVCGKPPGVGTYLPEEGDSPSEPRNTCPMGYAYDYVSTTCSSKGECSGPVVPRCEEPLFTTSLDSHPSLYYMCMEDETTKKLYPMLFRCAYGVYNASIYTCT